MTPKTHGGRRKGAGLKPTGRKPFCISLKPPTMRAIRSEAKRRNCSVSEVLEMDYFLPA